MAKVLEQGENYEADSVSKEEEEKANGPENDLQPPKNDKLKYIAIIGVAVLIVIALLVMIALKGVNKKESEEDDFDNSYSEDATGGNAASDLLNSDISNMGTPYEEQVSEPVATYEDLETVDPEAVELRKRGYTADEIEFARNNGISYDTMIQKADEEIKAQQQAVLAELSDQGSEAYQTLLNMTWLQGQDLNITDIQYDEFGNANTYSETKTMNIDYQKVPAKGTQLWLKCDCRELGIGFMDVDPMRWLQLADSGNILVNVTIQHWNDQTLITDITEIDAGDRDDYFSTDTSGGM